MRRCSICGGTFTCPANVYRSVLECERWDRVTVPIGKEEGLIRRGLDYKTEIKTEVFGVPSVLFVRKQKMDHRLAIVDPVVSRCIKKHFGANPFWVGKGKAAFYVLPFPIQPIITDEEVRHERFELHPVW